MDPSCDDGRPSTAASGPDRGGRPVRRQAERSAATRAKLLGAAIDCLHRLGYRATTVAVVADAARISRGAMTHHFPAKTDLMLAVVRHVFEEDAALYDRAAAGTDPARFLLELPLVMWRVIGRPAGIAVIEIMLASRSDPDLAERLRRLQRAIDARAHAWSAERIRAAGIPPHPDGDALHELFVAAVRGLAIEATFMGDGDGVHRSLGLLSDLVRRALPDPNP